jgi:uncharacterized protein YecE (DUF72 family)
VELNSSFYHLPLKSTVQGWFNRTPESFVFCPKLSRYVTHQLRLLNPEEPLSRFFDVFEPLKSKTGPVLIQLPPGLRYDSERTRIFFEILTGCYSDYRFAIEIRHSTWINDEFFTMLKKSNIAFTIADSGSRFPYHEEITADFIYLRFHGNGQLYASDYSEPELDSYSVKISKWLNEKKEVWIFFNNDIHGYALKNAVRLRELCSFRF